MRYIHFNKYEFSQLILGTVQLGIDYGISNVSGQPSRTQGVKMLEIACENGVSTFDTAREYGTAESVIAEARKKMLEQSCQIITKFRIDPAHESNLEKSWLDVLAIVRESLKILGLEKLDAVLFHRSPNNNVEIIVQNLSTIIQRLKEMNLIEMGGLSAHYPEDVKLAIDEEQLEIIQSPCNLFDHRLLNLIPAGRTKNKLIVARSIFLQGLFFMDPDTLSGPMRTAKIPLEQLSRLCQEHQISRAQVAVSFVRDLPQVDCLVIGAVNQQELMENIALMKAPALSKGLLEEIYALFSEVDPLVITPALWPLVNR